MRTPVVIVGGQGDTEGVTAQLVRRTGTLVVTHRFDGHVVRRTLACMQHGVLTSTAEPLELAHGCISCTIRDDLLILLRKLHRRSDVLRIVVQLDPWLEPEPICWAIRRVSVAAGPGFIVGPAARDVEIVGVVTCLDAVGWLDQALGDDEISDGRTVAQVVVGQAEYADVLVHQASSGELVDVLERLNPRARSVHNPDAVEGALERLHPSARRGGEDNPHGSLLSGQPPLQPAGMVSVVEFHTRRPFHPERLHDALDVLLEGVIRTRGRLWLACNSHQMMWLESAGGGLRVSAGGRWLAAMTDRELSYVDPERRALAGACWDARFGDRHSAIVALTCGARPDSIRAALEEALLTEAEMRHPERWAALSDPFGEWHRDPCDGGPDLLNMTTDSAEGDVR